MPSSFVLKLSGSIAIAGVVVYSLVLGRAPTTPSEWFAPMGAAAAVTFVGLQGFDRWIWRLPVVRSLHGRPVLHGTWHGQLASRWRHPDTDEQVPADPDVFLVVRQKFWSLCVYLYTKESASESSIATLELDTHGVCTLKYLYENRPQARVRDRSQPHRGAVVMTAPSSESGVLAGSYFTDRTTDGDLVFRERFAELVSSHDEGRALMERRSA